MKRKSRIITGSVFLGIIILLAGNSVYAQKNERQGPPPIPDDAQVKLMVQDLDKALSLTSEQEKEVSKKYFAHFEAVEKKIEAARPSREGMEAMNSEFEKEIKVLLTDDQKELFDSFLKEQSKKRPKR